MGGSPGMIPAMSTRGAGRATIPVLRRTPLVEWTGMQYAAPPEISLYASEYWVPRFRGG